MEIIFKSENGNLFGSTKSVGIGRKKPELIYGKKAKELREKANMTVEDLAKEFEVRTNIISKIENQQMALDDKMYNKYKTKFNVKKEYFFDLDLDTLILAIEGYTLKSFNTSEECKIYFDKLMDKYFNEAKKGKTYIEIDFSK